MEMSWTLILFVAYLALLVWAMRSRTRELKGPWWFFLRAFFPNWKFYHAVGRPPRLYVRGRLSHGTWLDWQLVYPRAPRRALHLVHNPEVNLALNQQNLVDHLSSDIKDLGEGADASGLVSYRLVCRLACQAARSSWPQGTVGQCQWVLRMERPGPEGFLSSDLVLQSPVMPC